MDRLPRSDTTNDRRDGHGCEEGATRRSAKIPEVRSLEGQRPGRPASDRSGGRHGHEVAVGSSQGEAARCGQSRRCADDARVTVAVVSRHGRRVIAVVAENRLIRIEVLLATRVDGKPVLDDELIDVVPAAQRHGLGTNFLGRQLEHAVRLGIAEIRAYAIRGDPGGDVGYRVWPILGFDGSLPRGVIEKLPPGLAAAGRVSELMETREGREWWIRNGDDIGLIFDLSPNRRLFGAFRTYLRRKGFPPTEPG